MSSTPTSVLPCTGSGELEAGQADLPAETHCPICKENFKNPVTIECEHKFCLSCISAFRKDLKDNFSCPVCHVNSPERNFQSNQQLSKLTEVAKRLPVRKGRRQRQIGERSQEAQPLALSCGQDQEVCSPSPTCHIVLPMEYATLCHRKQIEDYIKLWREKVESAEKVLATQRKRLLELKKRADRRREELTSAYQQYRLFLRKQRESILDGLENEEITGLSEMQANIEEFSDHITSLKHQLAEVRNNCVKSELDLLASVKDSYRRYKALKRPAFFSLRPTEYSYQFPPQYSGLDRIIKRFHVDVLLDPETANYHLKISQDKKIAQFVITQKVPRSHRRFCGIPVVLGSEGYSSGRQYWEVDVENKHQWLLGICQEPFPRRRVGSDSRNRPFSVHKRFRGVGLYEGKAYIALGHKLICFLPTVNPNRVGIFLDSEIHEVSFYNLCDKSLLYKFSDCPRGALWPYFYTGVDGKPLKICTPKDL
ncbi:tripartite motif-containing protein 60-like [Microtus oregoni]|uniref:tripartite motif-containing protein 60-like n=1 Tax=Microtus oregoni TaxID=111838 RepID=UPI001BB10343|nr:tripartite motif-containing protein 60-like [Microtus oregoni]